MERKDTDIFISGGGVAGLTAAAVFASRGFRVICAEPSAPVTDAAEDGADLRTTAFLQPAQRLLAGAGIWGRLAGHATPLRVMRIVDASGPEGSERVRRDFVAEDIGEAEFGWNFPNWLLRRELLARIAELPNLTFLSGVGFRDLLSRDSEARVTLTDSARVSARLVIAADGRASPVRQAAGIGVTTTRYGQKAVVFAVTHIGPHENISTEVHQSGGPFTLVPLPTDAGTHRSAVVWMIDGAEAQRLMTLPEAEFSAAATARSGGVNGPLTLASRRQVWPIISQRADRMIAERVALIAEAAHVMPPIGAQGLNMSLADIAALADLAETNPGDLGSRAMLQDYARKRERDVQIRVAGIDLLNRTSQIGNPALQDLRAAGIRALHDVTPVRKALMRLGLGAGRRD